MFGIDVHPVYQDDINFDDTYRSGYRAVFVKVSEGTSYVPPGLAAFVERIKAHDFTLGFYHFLDNSGGDRQAANFCKQVTKLGGPEGRVLIVDFEAYGTLTPSNRILKDFVAGVRKRFGANMPIILYSGDGFWNGGESSGDASEYGVSGLWDARYADMDQHRWPRAYWTKIRSWYLSNKMWGGTPPPNRVAVQYTSAGYVGGLYVDVNKFFISRKNLVKNFTTHDIIEPTPKPTQLERNIKVVKDYGLALLKHNPKYWCWDGGSLDRDVNGRPGCFDNAPPPMHTINKMFCADLITLQLRRLGKKVPKNGIYPGGTRSFKLKYGPVMKRFNLDELREGDVAFVDFQTPHSPEGHIGFCLGDGPDAKFLQSYADSCTTLEPGLNADWTIRESHSGFYYTHYIPREHIWG